MANLYADGVDYGPVLDSNFDASFPCMDSNYRELTWKFTVLKNFATFSAMLNFEKTTIPTYFSDREKNVTYGAITENNCHLQTFARKSLLSPLPICYAEYEVVFTKED